MITKIHGIFSKFPTCLVTPKRPAIDNFDVSVNVLQQNCQPREWLLASFLKLIQRSTLNLNQEANCYVSLHVWQESRACPSLPTWIVSHISSPATRHTVTLPSPFSQISLRQHTDLFYKSFTTISTTNWRLYCKSCNGADRTTIKVQFGSGVERAN